MQPVQHVDAPGTSRRASTIFSARTSWRLQFWCSMNDFVVSFMLSPLRQSVVVCQHIRFFRARQPRVLSMSLVCEMSVQATHDLSALKKRRGRSWGVGNPKAKPRRRSGVDEETTRRAVEGHGEKWWEAAEIAGVTDRTLRRWRERLEADRYSGLADRRKSRASEKRVPLATRDKSCKRTSASLPLDTAAGRAAGTGGSFCRPPQRKVM